MSLFNHILTILLYQLCIIQMHNYKGQLRRDTLQEHTPTKSSWDREKQHIQPHKYQQPHESRPQKHEDKYQTKYQTKYQQRYDTKYDKSQLSYYQSQGSRVIYDYDRSEKPSTRSQPYLPDQKYLFNEVITVRIKSFEREEYEQRIRIQIQMRSEKSYSLLTILLTDDINPRFLWMFAIREGDFMNLKHQQKLKVSYNGFPDMLKECFKQCQNEYQNEQKNNHLALQIRKGGQGKLSVLQSNRYKESTHLELQFKLANDEQLKQHLSNKYITAADQLSKAKGLISNLQNTLSQRNYEFERLNAQFNEFKRDGDKRIQQLKFEQKKKLNQLQSKYRDQMAKIKRESELQLKELKQKLNNENDTLAKSKTDLTNKLLEAKQRITNFQANEREQNTKITRLEQDVAKYLKDYQVIKTENKELSDRRFQNQKTITELSCKIQSLKSELEDKKTIISSTIQLKETNNNQISSLETQNVDQRKQIIKLQTKITELEGQNSKLNSNNVQLLEKIARQKQKLSQRGQIIKDQEKEVKQLKKTELTLTRENEQLQYRNNDKDNKIKNLQELLDNMQLKLQDQTKLVMALQKSLNQRPALRTTSNYTGAYQPSIPYSGVNRELPSQLSTTSNVSTSRVVTNLNNQTAVRSDKYEPNIRRYEQRSKSPIPKRLNQQRDPEEQQSGRSSTFQQPRPIKFKMSQSNREE